MKNVRVDGRPTGAWRNRKRWRDIPTAELNFSRVQAFDRLHPLQSLEFIVQFLYDCEWTAIVTGTFAEVADESAYAAAPPPTPCDRVWSLSGAENLEPYALQGEAARQCETCWHYCEDHAGWPWRPWERDVEVDVDASKPSIVVVECERPVLAATLRVVDRAEQASFAPGGYALSGADDYTESARQFDYYNHLFVPRDRGLAIRVGNNTGEPRRFAGRVEGHEFVAL